MFYPGFNTDLWHGILTAAGAPEAVITQLNRAIVTTLQTPAIRSSVMDGGGEVVGNTPAEFAAILGQDFEKYAKLVRISGAKAE